MDTGVLTAMGALLAGVAAWGWKAMGAMRDRIAALETSVAGCQAERATDQRTIGQLEAKVEALQSGLMRSQSSTIRLVVDDKEIIRRVSPNVTSILGWDVSDLVGAKADILVPEGLRPRHAVAFAARVADRSLRAGSITVRDAVEAVHAYGGTVPVRVALREEAQNGGKVFVVEVTKRD